jgi:hypothetical protein
MKYAPLLILIISLVGDAAAQPAAPILQSTQEETQEPTQEQTDEKIPERAKDVDLDFHFLKFGLTRKAVINIFGAPTATVEWHTLGIRYHRLEWVNSSRNRFATFFLNDRLIRWKKCTATMADC